MILLPSHITCCAGFCIMYNKHIHNACHSQTCYNFYYSVIWIITVASKASNECLFLSTLKSFFLLLYNKNRCWFIWRLVSILGKLCKRLLTYLRVYLQNITLLLVASSSRQFVDCCGYTLSLSLSTTTILNVPLIFFQAKEFEIGILFFELLSWNTLQFCAQLTVTTCSCYYQYPCFLYNKMFSDAPPPSPGKKIQVISGRQTDRQTLTPHAGIVGVAIMTLHHQSTWFLKCT